jgi:hypothetical protein
MEKLGCRWCNRLLCAYMLGPVLLSGEVSTGTLDPQFLRKKAIPNLSPVLGFYRFRTGFQTLRPGAKCTGGIRLERHLNEHTTGPELHPTGVDHWPSMVSAVGSSNVLIASLPFLVDEEDIEPLSGDHAVG